MVWPSANNATKSSTGQSGAHKKGEHHQYPALTIIKICGSKLHTNPIYPLEESIIPCYIAPNLKPKLDEHPRCK